jgi:hypothetical protein
MFDFYSYSHYSFSFSFHSLETKYTQSENKTFNFISIIPFYVYEIASKSHPHDALKWININIKNNLYHFFLCEKGS